MFTSWRAASALSQVACDCRLYHGSEFPTVCVFLGYPFEGWLEGKPRRTPSVWRSSVLKQHMCPVCSPGTGPMNWTTSDCAFLPTGPFWRLLHPQSWNLTAGGIISILCECCLSWHRSITFKHKHGAKKGFSKTEYVFAHVFRLATGASPQVKPPSDCPPCRRLFLVATWGPFVQPVHSPWPPRMCAQL